MPRLTSSARRNRAINRAARILATSKPGRDLSRVSTTTLEATRGRLVRRREMVRVAERQMGIQGKATETGRGILESRIGRELISRGRKLDDFGGLSASYVRQRARSVLTKASSDPMAPLKSLSRINRPRSEGKFR